MTTKQELWEEARRDLTTSREQLRQITKNIDDMEARVSQAKKIRYSLVAWVDRLAAEEKEARYQAEQEEARRLLT